MGIHCRDMVLFAIITAQKKKGQVYPMQANSTKQLFDKALLATIVAVGFGMPMAAVSATNITGHVVLTADADWCGLGPVALAEGATLNLNEHTLKVDALAQTLDPGEDVTSSDGVVTTTTELSKGSGPVSCLFDNVFERTEAQLRPEPPRRYRPSEELRKVGDRSGEAAV